MATAEQIIRRVLVRCGWPSVNAPLSDAEILELVDDEITSTLWPQLHAAQGDWHLARRDYTLVNGQALYRLPSRVWGPIKELLYVDSAGVARDLSKINIAEIGRLSKNQRPMDGSPYYAYADGDSLGLFPVPQSTDFSLRVIYYREPNAMCLATLARQITVVVDKQNFTLSSTIGSLGASVDFIGNGNAHQVISEEQPYAAVVGTNLGMQGEVPEDVQVGDWATPTGFTPVAPIPNHMIPQLCDRVAMAAMNSNGDQAGFNRNLATAKEREGRGLPTLEPRIEAEPDVIVPHSSPWRS